MSTQTPSDPAEPLQLSAAQWGILASNVLMWGGFFAIIPLLLNHFVFGLGWTALSMGAVLAWRQLTQQGVTVLSGAWSDQIGPKPLILVGCLIRTLGFGWMGFVTTPHELLLASLLAGLGGGLFDSPKSAALTLLTPPPQRARVYSIMGISGNLGMTVGPLIGAKMLDFGFQTAALAAASIYLVSFVVLALTLPRMRPSAEQASEGGFHGIKMAFKDTRFLTFTLVMIGYFLMSAQLNISINYRAIELGGRSATKFLYLVTAGLAIFLQFPLVRFAEKRWRTRTILQAAVAIVATALLLMGTASNLPTLLLYVALFSVGTMLVMPTQQTLVARLAPPQLVGSYFGFSALSMAIGGAAGQYISGKLLDIGKLLGLPMLPWLMLTSVGLVTFFGLQWALKEVPSDPE